MISKKENIEVAVLYSSSVNCQLDYMFALFLVISSMNVWMHITTIKMKSYKRTKTPKTVLTTVLSFWSAQVFEKNTSSLFHRAFYPIV